MFELFDKFVKRILIYFTIYIFISTKLHTESHLKKTTGNHL